ncbi:MAG: peptidoglycan DD-metalloendopeptidase family protein [Sulfurimonas sp.]|uniref:M23 family metallopeptidase n=1 Tax=Sulfurimonas sp. TaxID=2022749 RepID=UPI00263940BA|nr:M23 family metallopeptidase [Sulfurimonas sp.]MCW8894706.1 peptidoglycan DD-metalloendopeptidase family protein [Sulfurimonas sp.]MCW8955113.1 peptidoglycan DD-metalloendopeptidase family protein [Sulfurimonas sp.]MCW9067126.1 peptidoglycan DD-metalloendopeptidase family protein [Sulfurimonas sp.]
MMRLFLLFLFVTSLFGSKVESFRWSNGETYLMFLEKHNLPLKSLYYNLDRDDQLLTQEMRAGINYQILRDSEKKILQMLLPLNDELQIHIYIDKGAYKFEVIPIISSTKTEAFTIKINHSPYYDIVKETGSKKLAEIFVSSYKYSLNFKRDLRKGDTLIMIYDQKYRLGKPFSMPTLKVAMIEMKNKKHYIYLNDDDRYYDEQGNEVEGFLLARPVRGARISSYFTKRRFHPILKKWKAHLGVDYAARRGTPVVAAGSGRVIYAGRLGAYGNLIKIKHDDGYETRYAHLKSFRRGIKRGKYVKKGHTIGYVGSTGRSTGPHLHFELRKRGSATNPLRVVQVTTKKLKGKEKKAFLILKENYNQSVDLHLKNETKFVRVSKPDTVCYFFNGEQCEPNKLN